MIKNATIYRIAPSPAVFTADIEQALKKHPFTPCGATQMQSSGWIPPRGHEHGALLENVGGQLILKLMTEEKVIPSDALNRKVDEMAKAIEDSTGRKPGKKQRKEIKEEALLSILPAALTRRSTKLVWIDPKANLLVVDTSSGSKAEDVVTALVRSIDGLAVGRVLTLQSNTLCMSTWLATGEAPASFSVDRECELKSMDEMKSVVRFGRHNLDNDEVKAHIVSGKVPTRLAMTWEGRVSFVLKDSGLNLHKLAFLDVVIEGERRENDEAFDADVAIATAELSRLVPDLIEALGGEQAAELAA